MKSIIVEIADKKILVTAEFRPIIDFTGKNILCYQVIARFFEANDTPDLPYPITAHIQDPVLVNHIADFIFDTLCQLAKKKETLCFSFTLPQQRLNDRDYLATLHHQCVSNDVRPERIEIAISKQITRHQLLASLPFLNQAKAYGFMLSLENASDGAERACDPELRPLFPAIQGYALHRSLTLSQLQLREDISE